MIYDIQSRFTVFYFGNLSAVVLLVETLSIFFLLQFMAKNDGLRY